MLVTGEIYHILNRGIEDRIIFQSKKDYERFLTTVFECNDINLSSENRYRRCDDQKINKIQTENLVEIFAITLMPNHFHIAAKQLVDGGISKFMQRVGNSYTKYFNIKNERKGSLFMSRYKSVHVKTDRQILHLITYIHANPLDLVDYEWRNGKIKDFKKAKEFLENYNWSSYSFYVKYSRINLISQIINSEIVKMFYSKKEDHFNAVKSWSSRQFE